MTFTRAKIYFPSGAIRYTVGTSYNKDRVCSKITVDYNVVPPTISIWYNDNQEAEEFFNLSFSIE